MKLGDIAWDNLDGFVQGVILYNDGTHRYLGIAIDLFSDLPRNDGGLFPFLNDEFIL